MFWKLFSIQVRNIALAVLIVFGWEFIFPYHTTALTAQSLINHSQNNSENQTINRAVTDSLPNEQMSRLPQIANKPRPAAKKIMTIPVTAYSSTVDQCGADPFTTASGTQVHDGTLAANFLPIGTKVRFPDKFGNKIFVVEDRMHERYWHRADIWMPTREAAKQWGVKNIRIEIL